MERREVLRWSLLGGVVGLFGYMGFKTVAHFLPRPPKKIFIKEKDLPAPGKIKVGEAFFLIRLPDGRLQALSRRCPHLGCTVNYSPKNELFICPCHQSRFALTGARLAGPAPRGLYALKWEKSKGGIILEIPG